MGLTGDQATDEELEQVFIHESGHALVAALLSIPCDGICYQKDLDGAGMFCAVFPGGHSAAVSKQECLVSAAGVAAQLLVYPDRESDGAGKDREDFSESSALSFEEAVTASRAILLKEKGKLRRLVSMLKQRMREVDCDLRRLPEGEIDGKFYGVLLTKEDLNEVLERR
jgi:hypothetical protein